jgi:hypothetical protein
VARKKGETYLPKAPSKALEMNFHLNHYKRTFLKRRNLPQSKFGA